MYATYLVPKENAPRLREKLEKLSRKAVKLGCAAILVTLAKTFSRRHPDADRAADGERMVYEALTVQGEPPRLNGWVFAATLEHETAADGRSVTILRSHGEESLPAKYREATPDNCDHCHTNRRRNNTYVVRHEETGEWRQVGRSCLKDFLGLHTDPGAMARYATLLLTLEASLREECEGDYGANGWEAYDLEKFLAYTVQSIDDAGWVSRSQARETDLLATADAVWYCLTATTVRDRETYRIPEPTDAARQEVKDALAWVMAQDATDNDYIHNLQVIVDMEVVTWRTAGYAASIVSSYRRAKERNLRRAVLTASGTSHFGTVGKREEFRLTLLGIHSFEGYYGMTHLHRFADPDGNAAVWFASSALEMEPGASYRVKATVKKHNDYNGQPQTQLTRVAVQPLVQPVKKPRKRRARKSA